MLRRYGVAVTIGAVSSYGILREDEELSVGDEFTVVAAKYRLRVRTADFASGLGQDVSVTAGGVEYKIRELGRVRPDGTRELVLAKATP